MKKTRRDFLKISAALAAGTLISSACSSLSKNENESRGKARNRASAAVINLAFVVLGRIGFTDLKSLLSVKNVRAVVLCDPDKRCLLRAKQFIEKLENERRGNDENRECAGTEIELFSDYRKVFGNAKSRIDAAVIATPDHSHFAVAMEAVAHKKHVFVEKPICQTVDQLFRLGNATKSAEIISQTGNQGAASHHIRTAKEWFEAGILGEITEIQAWTNRPLWPQGMKVPAAEDPIPENFDWDIWLGAEEMRPYSKAIAPFNWRGWTDFGTGALGDMAQHILNPAFFILDLDDPEEIEAETENGSDLAFPTASKITFVFPENRSRGKIKIVWRDGNFAPPNLPQKFAGTPFPSGNGASVFYGTKNAMFVGASGETISLLKDFDEIKRSPPPKTFPRPRGNIYRNWIEAIRAGTPAVSNFEYSIPQTKNILLGVIAQRLGRKLRWNADKNEFSGDPEATALLKKFPKRPNFLC